MYLNIIFPHVYTYISEYSFQKSLYAYSLIYLWIIMIKCFVIGNFRGTCSSVEMLKGYMFVCRNAERYMFICWNAEGVRGKRKVGNPYDRPNRPLYPPLYRNVVTEMSPDRNGQTEKSCSTRYDVTACCYFVCFRLLCKKGQLCVGQWLQLQ